MDLNLRNVKFILFSYSLLGMGLLENARSFTIAYLAGWQVLHAFEKVTVKMPHSARADIPDYKVTNLISYTTCFNEINFGNDNNNGRPDKFSKARKKY